MGGGKRYFGIPPERKLLKNTSPEKNSINYVNLTGFSLKLAELQLNKALMEFLVKILPRQKYPLVIYLIPDASYRGCEAVTVTNMYELF